MKKLNETLKITILVSVAVLTLFYISFKIVKSDIEKHQYPITLNNDNYKLRYIEDGPYIISQEDINYDVFTCLTSYSITGNYIYAMHSHSKPFSYLKINSDLNITFFTEDINEFDESDQKIFKYMLKKEKDKITKVNLKNIKPSKVTDSYFGDGSIVLKKKKNSYVLYDRNNNKIIDTVKKFVFYNDQQYFDIDYKYSNIYPYIYVVGENSYIKIKLDPFNTYVAQLDDISDFNLSDQNILNNDLLNWTILQ